MTTEFNIGTFCPTCNEYVDGGKITVFDDRPANTILLEDFQMTTFCCENCGTVVSTPDYESMCEIEENYEDDCDEEDEENEN